MEKELKELVSEFFEFATQKKMLQQDIADKLGITQGFVSKISRMKHEPSGATVLKMLKMLGKLK